MRYLIFIPLGAMVVASIGLHSAACGVHVWAVERMWRNNPSTLSKGTWSHAYCKVMSAPLELTRR